MVRETQQLAGFKYGEQQKYLSWDDITVKLLESYTKHLS